jgi:hypothetical protein
MVRPIAYPPVAYAPLARQMAFSPAEQRNRWWLAYVLLLVGLLVGFGVGAVLFSGSLGMATQNVTVTSVVTSMQRVTETRTQVTTVGQTVTNTIAITGTGSWREIARFTGTVDKTTDPFNVPGATWRIRWSYTSSQPALFTFFVYRVGQSQYVESASGYTTGGSSILYIFEGQTNFFLQIVTNQNYEIIVEVPA